MEARHILGVRVDATSYGAVARDVIEWAKERQSRYISIATVNNIMRAYDDVNFHRVMREADIVTSDGMPLVWGLRMLGVASASRVYGPELTTAVLREAENAGLPVALYGGTPAGLQAFTGFVRRQYPRVNIVYSNSPPFRSLDDREMGAVTDQINVSGAALVFVGLSTPKQECWMARQKGRLMAPMLGIGAAFDFLGGLKPQAPRWMRDTGLEWLFRLITEPRRLWRRYLKDNPRFVVLFVFQILHLRKFLQVE